MPTWQDWLVRQNKTEVDCWRKLLQIGSTTGYLNITRNRVDALEQAVCNGLDPRTSQTDTPTPRLRTISTWENKPSEFRTPVNFRYSVLDVRW